VEVTVNEKEIWWMLRPKRTKRKGVVGIVPRFNPELVDGVTKGYEKNWKLWAWALKLRQLRENLL